MPIYEYACNGCGQTFEKLVRVSQSDGVACPACAGQDVRRLLSMFGFAGAGIKAKSASSTADDCGSCSSSGSHGCGGSCGCH